jgi:hypothetical protein
VTVTEPADSAGPETDATGNATVLTEQDRAALSCLAAANDWMRAVLCTLARRGVLVRRTQPERAQALLDALAPWPPYKAGQFLFDLMEWEDFMTDGPPPPPLPLERAAAVLDLPVRWLRDGFTAPFRGVREGLGLGTEPTAVDLPLRWIRSLGEVAASALAGVWQPRASHPEAAEAGPLPELEPGFHLYRDVVLGAVDVLGPLLDLHAPPPAPPADAAGAAGAAGAAADPAGGAGPR